jgi:hypothetical protein
MCTASVAGDKETPEKLLLVKVFTWLTTQMITGG